VAHLVFGWITPALLAKAKTVVRVPACNRSVPLLRAGALVPAYETAPSAGGRPVAVVHLTTDPVLEPLAAMPDDDYEAEGWAWLHAHRTLLPGWITASDFGPAAFDTWRARDAVLWVVRFRLIAAVVGDQASEALAEARAA
jgi:hypothetical protein